MSRWQSRTKIKFQEHSPAVATAAALMEEKKTSNSPKKVISTVKFRLTTEAFLRQRRVTLAASHARGMPTSF